MDCGESFPHYVMDFDHRPGENKVGKVNLLSNGQVSLVRLQQEIDKCDLVCANCHRQRSWDRQENTYSFPGGGIGNTLGSEPRESTFEP